MKRMVKLITKKRMKEAEEIQKFVKTYGQFPFGEREENYQDYFLDGYGVISGSRNVSHRFEEMKLSNIFQGQSVLDLGCQIGSMVQEAYLRGAGKCVGLDFQPEFLECAKKIAKFNGHKIEFYQADFSKVEETQNFIKSLTAKDFVWDIVFALSIYKHIEHHFETLLKNINFKNLYIEGHNSGNEGFSNSMNKRIENFLINTGWRWERLGMTLCRSPRCLWLARR
jgi:2-polyprenyl-3-methyl-5-hydroxy-6-metoxy-1,4-benzoquinol methylase